MKFSFDGWLNRSPITTNDKHQSIVYVNSNDLCVCVSPDIVMDTIRLVSTGDTVKIWDAISMAPLEHFNPHSISHPVAQACWSSNSILAAWLMHGRVGKKEIKFLREALYNFCVTKNANDNFHINLWFCFFCVIIFFHLWRILCPTYTVAQVAHLFLGTCLDSQKAKGDGDWFELNLSMYICHKVCVNCQWWTSLN